MNDKTASVIIVSRDRPSALLRCLKGVEQLYYRPFEVVVVADAQGIAAVTETGLFDAVKAVQFDTPNIAAARNLGIFRAAGDIVAFIDDDAVPEPTWLDHLMAAFDDPLVSAAGGFVRARNGISFQSTARTVDETGQHSAIEIAGDLPAVIQARAGRAIKTEGTNCAFRRDALLAMGGFDPAFHFYLDETDLNLRLAKAAHATAIVPMAQVHHGFAASAHRHANRMPKSLYDVGASQVVFLRKHARASQMKPALDIMRRDQRARLLRHLVAGNCEPRDISPVFQTLEDGISAGRTRTINDLPALKPDNSEFLPFDRADRFTESKVITGRYWSRRELRRKARNCIDRGERVSLYLFNPTATFHRVTFNPDGFWEQRGGVFGKSDRADPIFRLTSLQKRAQREVVRLSRLRRFDD